MPTYMFYIIALITGILLGRIIFSPRGKDGVLRVKKTSDDELTTLFELNIKPSDLLKKDIFILRVEQIE